MASAQAQIATHRASRYLVQFCKHAAAMGTDRHSRRVHAGRVSARSELQVGGAEWDHRRGVVDFSPQGRATLTADATTLTIRIDATDEPGLRAIQDVVSRDVERIGARDRLTVTWQPGPAA